MIELRDYNKKPYEELCHMLEMYSHCAYISATGTGKTYVVAKYIEEHFDINKVLVLVPNNVLKNTWEDILPGIEIRSYQSITFYSKIRQDVELIICDELHHLGATEWGKAYQDIVKNFSGKVIGLSATPIRYLDDNRDMIQECFHGHFVKGMDLPEAINKGILPSFHYITALYEMPKIKPDMSKKNAYSEQLLHQLDLNASRHSYEKILKKHIRDMDQKIVVFAPNINKLAELSDLTKQIFPNADHFVLHSKMSQSRIQENLAAYQTTEKRAFLYSVDMLSEGMHLDDISCVIMFRKTKSPVVYLQQLGRALTSSSKFEKIQIFDFVANHTNLHVYEKMNKSVISYIRSEITDPSKQIMMTDYAIEDLKILEQIREILQGNWQQEEDEVLFRYYKNGKGVSECAALLPDRTRKAISARADKLGLTSKRMMIGAEMERDILDYYETKEGREYLKTKYSDIPWVSVITKANRMGLKTRSNRRKWTMEEERYLLDHPDKTTKELMEIFHTSSHQITAKKHKLGIRTSKEYIWSQEQDQLIVDNADLTTKELQAKFFPEYSLNVINIRRKKLNASRKVHFTKEELEIFAALYQSGGYKEVQKHEFFAHMQKATITGIARRNQITTGNQNKQWEDWEIAIIKEYMAEHKVFHKDALKDRLPERTHDSIRAKITELKKET